MSTASQSAKRCALCDKPIDRGAKVKRVLIPAKTSRRQYVGQTIGRFVHSQCADSYEPARDTPLNTVCGSDELERAVIRLIERHVPPIVRKEIGQMYRKE